MLKLNEKQLKKYKEILHELQYIWEENRDDLIKLHEKNVGIRSSQIGAVVMLLIDRGVLK